MTETHRVGFVFVDWAKSCSNVSMTALILLVGIVNFINRYTYKYVMDFSYDVSGNVNMKN